MRKIICIVITVVLSLTLFVSCGTEKKEEESKELNVVATIFPEYDLARAIAADKADITMLMAPGASVHSFDPSPADIQKIQNADVFIYIGGETDEWVDSILDSLDTSNMKILRLMDHTKTVEEEIKEGMEEDEEEEHSAEEEHDYDEHVWTSPKNAIKFVDVICDAMVEKDSANSEIYKTNAQKYQNELKDLDIEIAEVVESAKHKKIIVADKFPFRYFVDAYGLDYEAAFPGCSDQADAGAKTIAHLVESVEKENISSIYYVELSNKSVATAIAEQTGTEMLLLNSFHNVSKTDFDEGVTLVTLMKDNIKNLRKGLN